MATIVKFFEGLKRVKEIISIGYLPVDLKPVEGSKHLASSGAVMKTSQELEEIFFANMDVPASTLRFSFGDVNYDPTQDTAVASRHNTADRAGGGTPAGYGGTWKKLLTKFANIWDYTYVDDTLLNEFDNGNLDLSTVDTETRFWNDVEHNPIKIIASNTAGCESFKRTFQGCWAITEVWVLDTSDALNMMLVFSYCKNLKIIPLMDMSLCTNFNAMFQYCYELESMPAPTFPDDDSLSYSAQSVWLNCPKLRAIDGTLNLKSITNIKYICFGCRSIESITMQNTSRINNFSYAFCGCPELSLDFFDSLDTSGATSMTDICSGAARYPDNATGPYYFKYNVVMKNITRMPDFDMSSCSNISDAFHLCNLESIDTTILSALSGSVNVTEMFRDNRNCKSGILSAYTILDAVDSSHANCFTDCGIDTEEGRAELEQIPTSWGGLLEE